MKLQIRGEYPENWPLIARAVKIEAGWRCIRCHAENLPAEGSTLTTHHWDGDKSNCAWWNLLALCQRCHLVIQAKVNPDQPWVYEHTPWFRPYVAGYYAHRYLGESLTRAQVEARLDELLALEAQSVLGQPPIVLLGEHG